MSDDKTAIKPVAEFFSDFVASMSDQSLASALRNNYTVINAYKAELIKRGYKLETVNVGGVTLPLVVKVSNISITKTVATKVEL